MKGLDGRDGLGGIHESVRLYFSMVRDVADKC